MEPITFRIATIEDSPEIANLINKALRPQPGSGGWTSEANLVSGKRTTPAEINSIIQKPSTAFVVGMQEAGICACMQVSAPTQDAYLGMMAVDPALQNTGIGKAMRAYIEEYASRVLGATSFVTLILAPRAELIALSRRRGYQQTGRAFPYPHDPALGIPAQKNLTLIEMAKRSDYWPRRTMNILFSRQKDWEDAIKQGFQPTRHKITFADFTEDNIRNYDLVVPLTIPELKFLSARRHLIPDNPVAIPAMETILLCDDKLLFNKALIAKGFGQFIPRMREPLKFPYIVKKRIDVWGVNSHVIANVDDEQKYAGELANPEYFRQIFIPGPSQYATHILFRDNKIVCSMGFKYTYDSASPVQGKDPIRHREIHNSPYLVLFASILRSIGFEGLCCFDYKILDNRPYILEINPRFGASLGPFFQHFVEQIA